MVNIGSSGFIKVNSVFKNLSLYLKTNLVTSLSQRI